MSSNNDIWFFLKGNGACAYKSDTIELLASIEWAEGATLAEREERCEQWAEQAGFEIDWDLTVLATDEEQEAEALEEVNLEDPDERLERYLSEFVTADWSPADWGPGAKKLLEGPELVQEEL